MAEEKESTGAVDIIAGILKSAPIETRKELGRIIRTDADIWNAVNGIGSIEGELPKGSLGGIAKSGTTLLADVDISVQQESVEIATGKTDTDGSFIIELDGGSYDFVFSKQDYNTETKGSEPIFPGIGMTKNVEFTSSV